MTIKNFETEQELEEDFEHIEEVHMHHAYLKDEIEEAKRELEYAERQLANYEDCYRGILFPK